MANLQSDREWVLSRVGRALRPDEADEMRRRIVAAGMQDEVKIQRVPLFGKDSKNGKSD